MAGVLDDLHKGTIQRVDDCKKVRLVLIGRTSVHEMLTLIIFL
jgi:hypothetical protein